MVTCSGSARPFSGAVTMRVQSTTNLYYSCITITGTRCLHQCVLVQAGKSSACSGESRLSRDTTGTACRWRWAAHRCPELGLIGGIITEGKDVRKMMPAQPRKGRQRLAAGLKIIRIKIESTCKAGDATFAPGDEASRHPTGC